ncbi:hypothetical protein E2C01_010340 [Portunus trituberculatus]|uniref:Uncharacterized protein n=1 Tax=Portunus trituberculatus TaxID=210409 RepID=A0A5B7D8F0_PORTR|nr:hypothetical protein [Portunus trituberculatus]
MVITLVLSRDLGREPKGGWSLNTCRQNRARRHGLLAKDLTVGHVTELDLHPRPVPEEMQDNASTTTIPIQHSLRHIRELLDEHPEGSHTAALVICSHVPQSRLPVRGLHDAIANSSAFLPDVSQAWREAPRSSNSRVTATWPSLAASCSGVVLV